MGLEKEGGGGKELRVLLIQGGIMEKALEKINH